MTKNPDSLPSQAGDRLMLFVAFPEMCLLDMSGPQTVFWAASRVMRGRGLRGYRCETVSTDGGMIRTAEGVGLETRAVSDFAGASIDTVMVPGAMAIDEAVQRSTELTTWLHEVSATAGRMTSVCNGAFLLAGAGVVWGQRGGAHWVTWGRVWTRF